MPVTFTRGTSKCRRRVGRGPEERLAWASVFFLHQPALQPSLSFSHPLLPFLLGQPVLILSPRLFHFCRSSTPEPGPHSRATGAITSSPGGPGRPATGLGAGPWLAQQCPLLTYAAENRREGNPSAPGASLHSAPSLDPEPSSGPAPAPTPVLNPGLAPPLRVACSPLAAVVQQEGQSGLHQLLAHQAGAFREGQTVRVLEEEPRRAAASWVQGEVT